MSPKKITVHAAASAYALDASARPPPQSSSTGKPLANYLTAKRIGDTLYLSSVIAVDPGTRPVINAFEDLPAHAITQPRGPGYATGQMSVDIFEAPAACQSWFMLKRIQAIVQVDGGQMRDVFKLVQYFRNLRSFNSSSNRPPAPVQYA